MIIPVFDEHFDSLDEEEILIFILIHDVSGFVPAVLRESLGRLLRVVIIFLERYYTITDINK